MEEHYLLLRLFRNTVSRDHGGLLLSADTRKKHGLLLRSWRNRANCSDHGGTLLTAEVMKECCLFSHKFIFSHHSLLKLLIFDFEIILYYDIPPPYTSPILFFEVMDLFQ